MTRSLSAGDPLGKNMWFHDRGVYEMPPAGEVTEPLSLPIPSPHLLEEGGHLADQAGAGALHLTAVPVRQEEVAQQGRVCERLHDAVHEARVPQVDEATQTWRRRAGSARIRTPPAHGAPSCEKNGASFQGLPSSYRIRLEEC